MTTEIFLRNWQVAGKTEVLYQFVDWWAEFSRSQAAKSLNWIEGLKSYYALSGQSLSPNTWPLTNFRPTELAKALSILMGPKAPNEGRSSFVR